MPNKLLDAGLANATIKYAWTNPETITPGAYVTDYHQLKDMKDGDTFWIVVVPNAGFDMGINNATQQTEPTTLKINVQSDGANVGPWIDNNTPANALVMTNDFFNNVKSTIKFTLDPVSNTDVTVDKNATLDAGLQNATLSYAWTKDGSVPTKWQDNSYDFSDKMENGYTFWVGVTPKDGYHMGPDQNTTLSILVQSSAISTADSTKPAETVVVTNNFFQMVKYTIVFTGPTDGNIWVDNNPWLNQGVANATLLFAWSSNGVVPQSGDLWVSDYTQLNDMANGYTFFVAVVPNDGFRMGTGQETILSIVVNTH